MFENMYAMIENTTICGANCIMCPRKEFSHKIENMPFETYKKIIDELVSGGCRKIGIIGFGDSLCDNELEKKLDYVKTVCPDMYISTINTGHLLNDKNRRIVNKYIDIIKFSMYGFTKKTYESVHRGSLVYEEVKNNIDVFLEENAGESGVYTIMTYLVMPQNQNEMEEWKQYYETKCNRIDIWKPHNWGGGKTCPQLPVDKICKRVMECNDIQICTDGSVLPCCFDFNRKLNLGNIKNESLKDILFGEKLKALQNAFLFGKISDSSYICKNCDQIRDRSDALIYCSDKDMKVGKSSMVNYGED